MHMSWTGANTVDYLICICGMALQCFFDAAMHLAMFIHGVATHVATSLTLQWCGIACNVPVLAMAWHCNVHHVAIFSRIALHIVSAVDSMDRSALQGNSSKHLNSEIHVIQ